MGVITYATKYPITRPIGIPIIQSLTACFLMILPICFDVVPIVFNKP